MRIVARPDFDGIVCAVLLYEAENITDPVKWVEPNDMQKGLVEIHKGDIIANLPYHKNCSLWFDHHYTNKIDTSFKGSFKIAPSAAGVIFEYYKKRFQRDYLELIKETDKIDAADLKIDEVLHPENYPYLILSMTISGNNGSDEPYWNKLIDLLGKYNINHILDDSEVGERCRAVIGQNKKYETILKEYTRLKGHVSITDFRSFKETPRGNRFLVYSLFPETIVSVKVRYDDKDKEKVIIGVGHSIFNPGCNVNVGAMLSKFEGGGHRGAGSCTIPVNEADRILDIIVEILLKNQTVSSP